MCETAVPYVKINKVLFKKNDHTWLYGYFFYFYRVQCMEFPFSEYIIDNVFNKWTLVMPSKKHNMNELQIDELFIKMNEILGKQLFLN